MQYFGIRWSCFTESKLHAACAHTRPVISACIAVLAITHSKKRIIYLGNRSSGECIQPLSNKNGQICNIHSYFNIFVPGLVFSWFLHHLIRFFNNYCFRLERLNISETGIFIECYTIIMPSSIHKKSNLIHRGHFFLSSSLLTSA